MKRFLISFFALFYDELIFIGRIDYKDKYFILESTKFIFNRSILAKS